jgi:hypothetical protein
MKISYINWNRTAVSLMNEIENAAYQHPDRPHVFSLFSKQSGYSIFVQENTCVNRDTQFRLF